jgi:hypothetical protein
MFSSISKNLSASEIEVTIIHSDIEHNSIVVRPYCKRYKNPAETYPPININFTSLNHELNIAAQLVELCKPTVAYNLIKENEVHNDLVSFIKDNHNISLSAANWEVSNLYGQIDYNTGPTNSKINFIA